MVNSVVKIGTADLIGQFAEISGTPTLSDSGTIAFSDLDLLDNHTVSVVGFKATSSNVPSALGILTATLTSDTANGAGGLLTWAYAVDAAAVEYLAAGQKRIEAFDVMIDDGNGGPVIKTVIVTVTGTNDAVVIVAADLDGGVTELAGKPASGAILADSGTIAFSDVDLTDHHSVTVIKNGLPIGSLLATVTADTANGTGGVVIWTYTVAASRTEYLAEGERRIETFDVIVKDGHGGDVTRTVAVTITGSNDGVTLASVDLIGAVTETAGAAAPGNQLSNSGTVTFTDVDVSDTHIVSVVGLNAGASNVTSALGSLAASVASDTINGLAGSVAWTYTVDAAAMEYLSAGQKRIEAFDVTVDDGHGGAATRTVVVTITGTNDEVVITAADLDRAVTETTGKPLTGALLTEGGTLAFSDADLADIHTVSVVKVGTTLGSVTASVVTDTVNGSEGSVAWTYQVAATRAEYLAAGEQRIESFNVTVKDNHGGTVTRTVAVTIKGSNDGVTLASVDLIGAVTETAGAPAPGAQLSNSGTVAFTDVDVSDTHIVSVVGLNAGASNVTSALGALTASLVADTVNGTAGSLSWTYTVDAAAVEYLAAGQKRIEAFDVTVDDGQGGAATRTVVVTVTGTNEAPVVAAVDVDAAFTETLGKPASGALLTDTGTLAFSDVDLTNTHTVSVAKVGTTLGNVTAAVTADTVNGAGGSVTWTYKAAASALEQLAEGQQRLEVFNVTIRDNHGGTATETVTVTLTGTNDGPTLATIDLKGAITETEGVPAPDAQLSDTGTVSFTDVDVADTHTVSMAEFNAGASNVASPLGTLAAVMVADTLNGTGGSLQWTYTVNAAAVEYLALGQKRIEAFDVTVDDGHGGTATKTVVVTVIGTGDAANSAPAVSGAVTGAAVEDGAPSTLDALANATDVDTGATLSVVNLPAALPAGVSYDAATHSFTLDPSNVTFQSLAQGDTATVTVNYGVSDGLAITSASVSWTVTGTNDAAVLSSATVNLGETDAPLITSGTLMIGDVNSAATFVAQAGTAGSYGTFTIGTDGAWTYTASSAHDEFVAGSTYTDTFNVSSADGTTTTVTVNILGAAEAAVVTVSSDIKSVTEGNTGAALNTSGQLLITAADPNAAHVVAQTNAHGTYGYFTIDVNGAWSYAGNGAHNELSVGQQVSDRFTVMSQDGTASGVVTVAIAGTNDAPGALQNNFFAGMVFGADPVAGFTAAGPINFTDLDLLDVHTVTVQALGSGYIGDFDFVVTADSNTQSQGIVTGTYTLTPAQLLAANGNFPATQSYLITVLDSHGGASTTRFDWPVDQVVDYIEGTVTPSSISLKEIRQLAGTNGVSYPDTDGASGTDGGAAIGVLSGLQQTGGDLDDGFMVRVETIGGAGGNGSNGTSVSYVLNEETGWVSLGGIDASTDGAGGAGGNGGAGGQAVASLDGATFDGGFGPDRFEIVTWAGGGVGGRGGNGGHGADGLPGVNGGDSGDGGKGGDSGSARSSIDNVVLHGGAGVDDFQLSAGAGSGVFDGAIPTPGGLGGFGAVKGSDGAAGARGETGSVLAQIRALQLTAGDDDDFINIAATAYASGDTGRAVFADSTVDGGAGADSISVSLSAIGVDAPLAFTGDVITGGDGNDRVAIALKFDTVGSSALEDIERAITLPNGDPIAITDLGVGDVTVTVLVTSGYLRPDATVWAPSGYVRLNGYTGLTLLDATYFVGGLSVTVSGTPEAINAALDGMVYHGTLHGGWTDLGYPNSETVEVTVRVNGNIVGFHRETIEPEPVLISPKADFSGTNINLGSGDDYLTVAVVEVPHGGENEPIAASFFSSSHIVVEGTVFDGGQGHDTLAFEGGGGAVQATLFNFESVVGAGFDDRFSLVLGSGNSLSGGGGADNFHFAAMSGGNTVSGGGGADKFSFAATSSANTITDFSGVSGDHDAIDLRAFGDGARNFGEVLQHAQQVGNDTVITYPHDGGDPMLLTLKGITRGDLNVGDFLYSTVVLSPSIRNLAEGNTADAISTAGMLKISDLGLPSTFVAQAGTVGNYGTFAIGTDGAWTYTASSAHDEFVARSTYTDTFNVASADGTLTSVTINIVGTDDAPVVGSRFWVTIFGGSGNMGTVIQDVLHEIAVPFLTTGATSLNIPAPTDVDSTMLIATVTSLPFEGNVYLGAAFGAAAVEVGETLTIAELTSLTYTPPAYVGRGYATPFSYSISDGSLATSAVTSASILINPYQWGTQGTEGNDIIVCNTQFPGTYLAGSSGADHFVFNRVTEQYDFTPIIEDFTRGTDVLDFSGAGFGLMAGSTANVVTASRGAVANLAAGSFILDNQNMSSSYLYFDANGGSGSDAIPIVLLRGVPTLSASDFLIV